MNGRFRIAVGCVAAALFAAAGLTVFSPRSPLPVNLDGFLIEAFRRHADQRDTVFLIR